MTRSPFRTLIGTPYLALSSLLLIGLTGCGSSSTDAASPSENQDAPTQEEQTPVDDNPTPTEDPQASLPNDGQSNILLIIADDLGVDNISLYNEQPDYMAATPSIDAIANNGVLFRNAWANPMCSPSRASIYTGLHAYNHGVLTPGNNTDEEFSAGILTQAGYSTALFGKWHLGGGRHTAEQQGFEYFSGTKDNLTSYFDWTKEIRNSDGSIDTTQDYTGNTEQNYATTVTATDAIEWINNQTSPWFATVAFHAGHSPLHVPPNVGDRRALSGAVGEDCATSGNTNQQCFRAMVEVMDHYIGDILEQVDTSNTVIIFVADNGPAAGTVYQQDGTPFIRTHSKGTVYEGGINVPLIIGGGENITLNNGEENALIQVQDIFSTVLDIANTASINNVDGQTLRPYLDGSQQSSDRTMLYSELFSDSGTANTVDGDDNNYWTVLDASSQVKYLYVEDSNETDEKCFDLNTDITEENDVFDVNGDASNTCNQLKTQRPCLATGNCPAF